MNKITTSRTEARKIENRLNKIGQETLFRSSQ